MYATAFEKIKTSSDISYTILPDLLKYHVRMIFFAFRRCCGKSPKKTYPIDIYKFPISDRKGKHDESMLSVI